MDPPNWQAMGEEEDELRTPEDQLQAAMQAYAEMGKPCEGALVTIIRERPGKEQQFLSGNPYLWSAFHDRAFAFANTQDAAEFITRFPTQLAHCRVLEFK